jgi:hypothetical protein
MELGTGCFFSYGYVWKWWPGRLQQVIECEVVRRVREVISNTVLFISNRRLLALDSPFCTEYSPSIYHLLTCILPEASMDTWLGSPIDSLRSAELVSSITQYLHVKK